MKKILLLLCVVSISSIAFGQYKKNYFNLSGGAGVPVGEFKENDGGAAETGLALSFSYGHKFMPYFGIATKLLLNTNSINTDNVMTSAGKKTDDFTANQYQNIAAFLGVTGHYPITDRLNIDGRVLFGSLSQTFPQVQLYGPNQSWSVIMEQADSNWGFAYNLGLGISYNFASHWAVTANMDYVASKVKYDEMRTRIYMIGIPAITDISKDQELDFGTLNFTAGISYCF